MTSGDGAPQSKSPTHTFGGCKTFGKRNIKNVFNQMLLKKFAHLFHPLKIISENSVKVRMTDFNAPIAVNAKYIISRYHESLFCTSVSNYFTVTLFQLLHLLRHYSTDHNLLQI